MIFKNNLKMVGNIDLPDIEPEVITFLLKWHDQNKSILANPGARQLDFPWLASTIRNIEQSFKNACQVENEIPGGIWNKDFVDEFPKFIELLNKLPFNNIQRIYMLETRKKCKSHVDSSKFLYDDLRIEPCNYRVTLRNSSKSKGFFIQPKPRSEWGSHRAIRKESPGFQSEKGIQAITWTPKIGSWWILNNYCCQHGSDWNEGDNKVILSIQGQPNTEKHLELLNRSTDLNALYHPYLQYLSKFYELD